MGSHGPGECVGFEASRRDIILKNAVERGKSGKSGKNAETSIKYAKIPIHLLGEAAEQLETPAIVGFYVEI